MRIAFVVVLVLLALLAWLSIVCADAKAIWVVEHADGSIEYVRASTDAEARTMAGGQIAQVVCAPWSGTPPYPPEEAEIVAGKVHQKAAAEVVKVRASLATMETTEELIRLATRRRAIEDLNLDHGAQIPTAELDAEIAATVPQWESGRARANRSMKERERTARPSRE